MAKYGQRMKKSMKPKRTKLILGSVAALFSVWMVAAPFLIPEGTAVFLDGKVGTIDHAGLWNSMNPFSGVIYWLGDFFCHQESARTFMLNGNELPFCSRDVSLYASVAAGFFLVCAAKPKRSRKTDVFVAVSFSLIVLDWFVQRTFSLNVLATRIITGALAGIAISLVLSFMLDHYLGYCTEEKDI